MSLSSLEIKFRGDAATKIVVIEGPKLETKINPNTVDVSSSFLTLKSVLIPSVGSPQWHSAQNCNRMLRTI